MIRLTFRALGRKWPELLAWFLAGWAVRLMLIQFAGWAGDIDSLLGFLILPLAVLARLASYIGMFLVVRSELNRYERLEAVAKSGDDTETPGFVTTWANTVGAALVPFFVIYAAWGLINDDGRAYTIAALNQSDFSGPPGETALDTPFEWQTIAIVVVAFVLRRLLSRFSEKLPSWTGVVAVYLEAVWVFIALAFIKDLLAGVPHWFATRRMFAWAVDGWAHLQADYAILQALGDAWEWIAHQLGEVVFQPLAWLALASIVLAGALPLARRRRQARMSRLREATTARWRRVGPRTRRILMLPVNDLVERWQPIGTALRLIWRAGPVTLGVYVLAFAVLTVGGGWLQFVIYHAFGPHEEFWWLAWDEPLTLLLGVLTFPLQICLVAAAFDRCLRALDDSLGDEDAVSALAGADTSG